MPTVNRENLLSRIQTDYLQHNDEDWDGYLGTFYDECIMDGELYEYHNSCIGIVNRFGFPTIFYADIEQNSPDHLVFILETIQKYKELGIIPLGQYLFGLQFLMKRNSILRYHHNMVPAINVKFTGSILEKTLAYLNE